MIGMTEDQRKSLEEIAAESRGNKGLLCPRCGCRDLRVFKTRHNQSGSEINRRRICRNCGYRVSTMEIIP